jgi:lipopolysaccharide export system permease protein
MPIFWKYLSKEYLKIFFISILSFISILLVTRLKEIASFATLSNNIFNVFLFTLYQIPFIMPIAMSISCLISAVLLFQKLSSLNELTAFRASGLSLKNILAPLLILAMLLSFLNFLIASELSAKCRVKTKELLYEKTSINPIILLQKKQKLSNIKNSYIEIDVKQGDKKATDLILVTLNRSSSRLSLANAEILELKKNNLVAKDVSFISYLDNNKSNNFDNLIIENQKKMITNASSISTFIKSKSWSMTAKSLPIRMLLLKSKEDSKINQKHTDSAYIEITKRIAFALCCFSFTFIGASFSIQLNRVNSKKNLFILCILTLIILSSFTLSKSFKQKPILAIISYIMPQLLVLMYTAFRLKKISKGNT